MKAVVIGVTDPAETAKEGARRTRFNRTSLLRARQEFREAVVKGAAEADRGELIDGEQVFKEIEGRLRQAKRKGRTRPAAAHRVPVFVPVQK
jgi:predicted transcriptional regulator